MKNKIWFLITAVPLVALAEIEETKSLAPPDYSLFKRYAKLDIAYSMPDRITGTKAGKDFTIHKKAQPLQGKFAYRQAFGGGVGYTLMPVRVDIMLNYRRIDKYFSIKSQNITLNGYLDGYNETPFTPYVTAAIGVHKTKIGNFIDPRGRGKIVGQTASGLIWHAGLGSRIELFEHFDVDFFYRYVTLNGAKLKVENNKGENSQSKVKATAHEVGMGVVYRF